jgi:hypothetical protein
VVVGSAKSGQNPPLMKAKSVRYIYIDGHNEIFMEHGSILVFDVVVVFLYDALSISRQQGRLPRHARSTFCIVWSSLSLWEKKIAVNNVFIIHMGQS